MSFKDEMQIILPPKNGINPHVTSDYGVDRSTGTSPHVGVDFNYIGGQNRLNNSKPEVDAPISGQVIAVGGKYGWVIISDEDGFTHRILHLASQSVSVGDYVEAGDPMEQWERPARRQCMYIMISATPTGSWLTQTNSGKIETLYLTFRMPLRDKKRLY